MAACGVVPSITLHIVAINPACCNLDSFSLPNHGTFHLRIPQHETLKQLPSPEEALPFSGELCFLL